MSKIKDFFKSKNIQAAIISAFTAAVISAIGFLINWTLIKESNELSRQAIKISEDSLKFNVETQRARLYIDLISPPQITFKIHDNALEVICYLTVTNIGRISAKEISAKNAIKPEILNVSAITTDMSNYPTPIFIKPEEKFWITAGFEVVTGDAAQKEKLIKEIEEGKVNIVLDVAIKYLDSATLKEYLTSASLRFNKQRINILRSNID